MAKVSAGDIRNGITIEVNGKVCQVIDFMHVVNRVKEQHLFVLR